MSFSVKVEGNNATLTLNIANMDDFIDILEQHPTKSIEKQKQITAWIDLCKAGRHIMRSNQELNHLEFSLYEKISDC